MQVVYQHQNHTEAVAESSYRMKTSKCSQIFGGFVSSYIRKHPHSSPLENSPKRTELVHIENPKSADLVQRASRFMLSKHKRQMKNKELEL